MKLDKNLSFLIELDVVFLPVAALNLDLRAVSQFDCGVYLIIRRNNLHSGLFKHVNSDKANFVPV